MSDHALMTVCEHVKNQSDCPNYKRATHFQRCMYLRFEEFCDFVPPQNKKEKTEK